MNRIPNEIIDEIRSKVNIVDVISQYVNLNKRGQGYTASCPFHEDRNPSFSIHTGKQIYKCFSCGRGGNVFSFIQEIEGISFIESVKKVAEFANIPIDSQYFNQSYESHLNPKQKTLYLIHEKVAEFYHYYLTATKNGQQAYDYLRNRRLSEKTIKEFGLGLAPANSKLLLSFLESESFSQDDLLTSGVFYLDEKQELLVDRFRDRLIFPLRSSTGSVLAFSGRVYLEEDQRKAKYVNSPETEIFHKSRLLYNIDLARPHIRKHNQALVCEGFMDVIALHDAGYHHAVATMGTSLTKNHLDYLTKLSNEIIFVFDGDQAGQKATESAFRLAEPFQHTQFKSITIPQSMDPDEWIAFKGEESFQQLINQAIPAYTFRKHYIKQQYNIKDKQELANYIEELLSLISKIQSSIEQELYVTELSKEYQIDEQILKEQLARIKAREKSSSKPQSLSNDSPVEQSFPDQNSLSITSQKAYQSEKLWLGQLIFYPQAWHYLEKMQEMPILYHQFAQKAFMELFEYYYAGNQLPLTGIVGSIKDTQLNSYLSGLMWEFEDLGYDDQIMDDCLSAINEAFIMEEISELKKQVKTFILNHDQEKIAMIVNKIIVLERQLKLKQ